MKRLITIAFLVVACNGGGEATATQAPTQPPAAEVTPDPTPDPAIGTGVITFGLDYDEDTLGIISARTKFKRNTAEIAYSASLSESVGGTSITIVIASQSSSGSERVLVKEDIDVANPDSDTLANKVDLASIVDNKVGTYVMRYIRDGDVLAEGTFTLVK